MKINLLFTALVVMGALVFLSLSGLAESLDIKKMMQGTVKEVNGDSIEILDDQNGHEVRAAINSNTVYDNAQKSTDLKIGDKVQIEYQEEHNKNTASVITKLEMENEDSL